MWLTNLKVGVVALAVIGFYTAVAHVIPQLESEVPEMLDLGANATAEELVTAGERLYNGAGGCTACHGLGTRAPNLLTDHGGEGQIGARCATRQGGLDCKAYLWQSMVEPGTHVVAGFGNIMPNMQRQLTDDQIWSVIAFLQSQGGEVTVSAADLQAGQGAGSEPGTVAAAAPARSTTTDPRQLLQENACLGCHQLDGEGPPIGPSFDGMGSRVTAERIRRGILDPNAEVADGYQQFAGMMPATFGEQLSAAQLEAIVQFLAGRE
jgi:mono/diheme cytochrome c family protein